MRPRSLRLDPPSFLPRDRTALALRAIPRRYSITMLQSTVSTGSYILQKYSRSYPSSTSSQTQSQDQVAGQSEWQHFTNPPALTLTLDIKKSADNKLFESVRLRIIWNLDDGAQREIIMVRTMVAYMRRVSTSSVFVVRKTSICCRFPISITKFTLRKDCLSKPSIGAPT